MPAQNIASAFESLIFRVSVDDDAALELRMEYLSHKGAVLRIISPPLFSGNTVSFPNVPSFAMPGLFGYYYYGWLTPKF